MKCCGGSVKQEAAVHPVSCSAGRQASASGEPVHHDLNRRGVSEGSEEAVEEELLAAKDSSLGHGDGEPGAAVDLGNFDHAASARGPLDEASVGDEGVGVEIAFDGPGDDLFAGGLADDVEGDEAVVGQVGHERGAGFFLEFATRGVEGFFIGVVLAFGDGPGVFFGPEGAAGMDEEDFGTVLGAAKEEDAGGVFAHGSPEHYRSLATGYWVGGGAREDDNGSMAGLPRFEPTRVGQSGAELPVSGSAVELANYQRLVARTVDVFGDELKASRWLSLPSPDFDGAAPLQYAQGHAYDPQALEPVLTRIEHGIDF
jgi:hypothetical protein